VAPIFGIGKWSREEAVRRVRNPEDGTNRDGYPGEWTSPPMSLKGKETSGGSSGPEGPDRDGSVCPEEEFNLTEAVGAPAPIDRKPENREVVKATRRGS
jgi:hypothetical protein